MAALYCDPLRSLLASCFGLGLASAPTVERHSPAPTPAADVDAGSDSGDEHHDGERAFQMLEMATVVPPPSVPEMALLRSEGMPAERLARTED